MPGSGNLRWLSKAPAVVRECANFTHARTTAMLEIAAGLDGAARNGMASRAMYAVAIPVKNEAHRIIACIDSLAAQSDIHGQPLAPGDLHVVLLFNNCSDDGYVLAREKLRKMPHTLVCDALLDQTVFAGVGNIIKNEVLFRIRVHPLSTVGALSVWKLRQLVEQARVYTFEFLAWKKAHVLARHWLVHNRGRCPRHDIPLQRAYLGKTDRRSFFCLRCQKLYTGD